MRRDSMAQTRTIMVIICIIGALLLAGCGYIRVEYRPDLNPSSIASTTGIPESTTTDLLPGSNPAGGQPIDPQATTDLIEENINAEDLAEDEALTDDAAASDIPDGAAIPDLDAPLADEEAMIDPYPVLNQFETSIPDGIVESIQYDRYPIAHDYILITAAGANIREKPDHETPAVGRATYFEKLTVLAEVKGRYASNYDTDIWYEVLRQEEDHAIHGYVLSALAVRRTFQFQKMAEALDALQSEIAANRTGHISNYKNRNGAPPAYNGMAEDPYGVKRHQSAPAYRADSVDSDFRYISDGALVSILDETETSYKISTLNFPGSYFVPKKYVSFENPITELTQVIVVDRNNQNEGVFEFVNGTWHLISKTYATTGEQAKFKEPTSLGYYKVIQKVPRFLYLDDVTRLLAGYAPFALRFNGGAYVHGVPVDLTLVDNVPVYPPTREYLYTIGTVPRSHKCVRNYTSHAKFLYDWCTIGQAAVIVIE